MTRAAVLAIVLAGCFGPQPPRPEHSALAKNAGSVMVAATSSIPPEAAKQHSFDEHYQAAIGFYEKAQFPEAIAEFETAYEVDPQPLLLFNIGQAYRKSGHLEEALAKYREYLDKDPSAERGKVDVLIRDVEKKLAPKAKPGANRASRKL